MTEAQNCTGYLDNKEVINNGEEPHPAERLRELAKKYQLDMWGADIAARLDQDDKLKTLREKFHYPKMGDLPDTCRDLVDVTTDCVYLVGNSLGLQPKGVRKHIDQVLDLWAKTGVHGHFMGPLPWAECDERVDKQSAVLVGAKNHEVAIMNGLTVNIHLLLMSFYRPTSKRYKILLEGHSFPSDHYVCESQIQLHGYKPAECMILLEPREGEHTLRKEDILSVIEEQGDSIAVVLFPGVQYYTGQLFPMQEITQAAHKKGCYVGFDLAHAVGNVEICLHAWDVDFACWCTYKYLNSGAGGIAGAFMHERFLDNDFPKLRGWWGHKYSTRFKMTNVMDAEPGIRGYRLSNPPPLLCASLLGSLDVFMETSMKNLRVKSKLLTGYMEMLLLHFYPKYVNNNMEVSGKPYVEIITPTNPEERGCQLSVMFSVPINKVYTELVKRGVALDKREPNVLRVAPTALYNSFTDVYRFVQLLGQAMHAASLD